MMNRKQIMLQIGLLLDSHTETMDTCGGCDICTQVRKWGEELDKISMIPNILAKGQGMKISEIDYLLTKEVPMIEIRKALKLGHENFQILMYKLGFDVGKKLFYMEDEEYNAYKQQGLSNDKIADLKGVTASKVNEWARRRRKPKMQTKITKEMYRTFKAEGMKEEMILNKVKMSKRDLFAWKKASFTDDEIKGMRLASGRKKKNTKQPLRNENKKKKTYAQVAQ